MEIQSYHGLVDALAEAVEWLEWLESHLEDQGSSSLASLISDRKRYLLMIGEARSAPEVTHQAMKPKEMDLLDKLESLLEEAASLCEEAGYEFVAAFRVDEEAASQAYSSGLSPQTVDSVVDAFGKTGDLT